MKTAAYISEKAVFRRRVHNSCLSCPDARNCKLKSMSEVKKVLWKKKRNASVALTIPRLLDGGDTGILHLKLPVGASA